MGMLMVVAVAVAIVIGLVVIVVVGGGDSLTTVVVFGARKFSFALRICTSRVSLSGVDVVVCAPPAPGAAVEPPRECRRDSCHPNDRPNMRFPFRQPSPSILVS